MRILIDRNGDLGVRRLARGNCREHNRGHPNAAHLIELLFRPKQIRRSAVYACAAGQFPQGAQCFVVNVNVTTSKGIHQSFLHHCRDFAASCPQLSANRDIMYAAAAAIVAASLGLSKILKEETTMKRTAPSHTVTLPALLSFRARLAIAAGVLALVAIPHFAEAQGIVGGARDGSREGYRAAGPVGGLVGGALGAGVGGAVGGVKGVLGIPDQGYNPNPGPAYRAGYKPRRHYHRHHHRRYR